MPELPATEEDQTEVAGQTPTQEESARRTPDESTIGLAQAVPASPSTRDDGELVALQVGELLAGRFTILRFIARGGMGAVYEASDVLLRTRVALKVLGGRFAGDTAAMERFRRELLLARRVSHPNVCRVYELYEARTARGIPIHFLTMELLAGESLARRLARTGRMTTDEALPLVKQICEGLAAAHAEGVIHRDFKSSNVLLVSGPKTGEGMTEATRAVITDFGVARALQAAEQDSADDPLTGQGILGTPEYMAPEQVTGAVVTAATDIYSLGVVVYEMVTGKLPFAADTRTVPGLDRRWAAAIVRCLASEPERRFRNAREVVSALDRPTRSARAALPVAMFAALLLLVGAYGVVRYRPSLRRWEPEKKTALVVPRPMVAILGFRDEIRSEKLTWVPTAVSELLAYELAAAESSLRVSQQVDLELRSLGVSAEELGDEKTQRRLQELLDADILVHGSLSPAGSDGVHLHLRSLDARSRREVGSLDEELGSGGERLVEALASLGRGLRNLLKVSLTAEEESSLLASRAHNVDAAKLHAEGVIRFRVWDVDDARSRFEAAVAADPGFYLPHRAIVRTAGAQSNRKKYLEGVNRIHALRGPLPPRLAAQADLAVLRERDEDGANEALKALFEASPDDFQVGSSLLQRTPPRAKLALIKRMQQMRAGPPLLLALQEGRSWGVDLQLARERLDHVVARATELGARWELGQARLVQAQLVPGEETQRRQEALDLFAEAERLTTEVGDLPELARVKRQKALWLTGTGSRRDALGAMDDAAGAYRRLGDLEQVAHLLLVAGDYLRDWGELSAARKRLEAARRELETIDSQPDGIMFCYYFRSRAWQLFDAGDLDGARDALRRARRSVTMPQWAGLVELLEARILDEEDHREEARGTYSKAQSEPVFRIAGACTVDCDGDQPAAGLDCLAKTCRPDDPELKGIGKASCQVEEASCRYRAGDLARAEQSAREAAAFLDSKDYYELGLRNRAILMRVAASRGESAKAIRTLRADLTKAESEKNTRLAFEAALALGDVELKAGRAEGRTRLAKLEQDAKSREFFRIARLAREVLDRKPVASVTPRR